MALIAFDQKLNLLASENPLVTYGRTEDNAASVTHSQAET